MTATKKTFDVFRAENRRGGNEDWIGETTATDSETAQWNANREFECDAVHQLYVREREEMEEE